MILALDLGTKCGWAILHDDDSVTSGVWDLSVDGDQLPGWRYLHMQQKLAAFDTLELVAFEDVRRHEGTTAAHVFGGLKAVLQMWCATRPQVRVEPVGVGVLKRWATGKGNANKELMREAARRLYPQRSVESFDEADALCTLAFVVDQLQQRGAA